MSTRSHSLNPTEYRVGITYKDGNRFSPLPSWSEFFIRLGDYGVRSHQPAAKLRMAATVPTRAFAATFAAAGAVIAQNVVPVDRNERERYLEWLCTNHLGAKAKIRDGSVLRHAEVISCAEDAGHLRICCKVHRGRTHDFSKLSGASLDKLVGISERLNLKEPTSGSVFLTGWSRSRMPGIVAEFCLNSDHPPVIVGSRRRLGRESKSLFRVCIAGQFVELGDLQRILALDIDNSSDPIRCRVLAPSSEVSDEFLKTSFVIFDGTEGFLEHRHSFAQASYVVILDRSESRFDEGLAEFRSDYALNAPDEASSFRGLPTPPPGVELASYVERPV